MKNILILFLILLVFCFQISCSSVAFYDSIRKEYSELYPYKSYIMGVSVIDTCGDQYKDSVTAKNIALSEIAKQMRIHLEGETIDIVCERRDSNLFKDFKECRNEITSTLRATVDEVLDGSMIEIKEGPLENEKYFAVAALARMDGASEVEENINNSIQRAGEAIKKAKETGEKGKYFNDARAEYLKAIAYENEKIFFDGKKTSDAKSRKAFAELEKELSKIAKAGRNKPDKPETERTFQGRDREINVKVVEAEGIAMFGEDTTLANARGTALNNARSRAIEKAVGIILTDEVIIYNEKLVSQLISTAKRGLIVGEKILEDRIREGNPPSYYVKLKAFVQPLLLEKRGNFKILTAEVKRVDSQASSLQPVFNDNDELQIRVRVNEDSFISIFSVYQDGKIIKILPNHFFSDNRISSGEDIIFPTDSLRETGVKLRVRTPKNLSRSVESVLVIATREKQDFLSEENSEEAVITDLMKEIGSIEPSAWTEKVVGYEVRR